MKNAGDAPEQIAGYGNTVTAFPVTYSWARQQHNGYPDEGVLMAQANSLRAGTFKLAPAARHRNER